MSNKVILDNKYIIIEEKGRGLTSRVFLVKDIETEKIYAAKILFKKDTYFENEKEILELLKDKNVPYIVNLISSGIGEINIGENSLKKQYLILEYAEKGDLCRFIKVKPLKEIHAKLFFKKILKAVQCLHEKRIYHRDLKTGNILLDNKFNPLLCDFGFSTITKSGLKDKVGTFYYAAPEIYKNTYDGERVDIFALGVILFNLVTGKYGFNIAMKEKDNFYKLIAIKFYKLFWKKNSVNIGEVSEEFKNLYVRMVAYKFNERPTIEEVLKDDWMKEINNKSEKEIEDLELEIYNDFLEREKIMKDLTNKNITKSYDESNGTNSDSRAIHEEKNDFENDLLPSQIKEKKFLGNYNVINGNLNPVNFMNDLTRQLRKENDNKKREYQCAINPSEYKLKFIATFKKVMNEENDEKIDKETEEKINQELEKLKKEEEKNDKENNEEEEEEEEEDDEILNNDCSIKIELFEYGEKKHLLRFVRKEGDLEEFYKILTYINNCVDKIIN